KNLLLTTPNTRLEKEIEIGYESPSLVAENPGNLWMQANFKNSVISHKDLLTVAPLLYDYPMFADLPNAKMQVNGKIRGYLKDLELDNLTFRGFGNTSITANGKLTGLPDPDKIGTNLVITEFSTTDEDLIRIIPEGLIPPEIELPKKISVKGSIKGSYTRKIDIDAVVNSTSGNLTIKGFIANSTNPKDASYKLKGKLTDFNVGALLKRTDVGKMTMAFDVDGKSFEPSLLSGFYNLNLISLEYNNYTYKDISFNARANEGIVQANSFSPDSAHTFDLDLYANMRNEYPVVNSSINLQSLDLQKLGFSEAPLIIRAKSEIDIPKLDPDHPTGYFLITELDGIYDTVTFKFDSISTVASYYNGIQLLDIKTDFARAKIKGEYSVSALFPEIINYLNLYYIIAKPSPALRGDQQADIDLIISPSTQLNKLLPSLELHDNIEASLKISSKTCLFDLKGRLPEIQYGTQKIRQANFFMEARDSSLEYKIFIDDYQSSIYSMPTILLQGDISQRLLFSDIRLLDDNGRLQHTLAAFIRQRDSGYAIHIDPESVTLDYESWRLSNDNELFISSKGIFANSFTFSNGSQALVLQTFGDNMNDPLGIRLFNFKFSTFTSLARQDSLYLDGTVNGYAEIQLSAEHPVFFADIIVDDLMFKNDTLGNISLNANSDARDIYKVDAKMTGYGNEVMIGGTYNLTEDAFDIQFDIEKLRLKTIEPFALGYMNQMKGHLEGGLYISGKLDNPVVIGNMVFRDAEGNIPLLNSVFSLRNERIRFMQDGMYFNDFTLTDKNNKKAILNGNIKTENWLDYAFNLDFIANDFQVINSTRKDNNLFYGTLFLDTKINFRGTSEKPVITAGFRANPKTDLTMVLPQSDPELAEREGVVEFFDADMPEDDSAFVRKVDSLSQTGIRGLSLHANIEVDPQVKLSFIIDEANGDMLIAKGTANLSSSIDPSGKVSVTGTYELVEGSYSMTLKVFKFNFDIEKGSTIIWTGEPTNADINVTALYNVKTAPYDLVEQQITGESDETKAKYKDRIPFKVKLIIKGDLLEPIIKFDLVIAETSGISAEVASTVNSKLDQLRIDESQMNQQVFALILFNSFIPENPFASSSSGNSASTLARQSVSKLLSSQLNQLAGSLISGVDVDIGIDSDEDYSMGTGQTRTDLNVALSKRLLKDRLKITVGSNFELEGTARPNEKTTNIAGDIKADYSLTRDGRYVLRAYRVDQYEVALQGQVVETGVTFIINLNFDDFREIFEKKKKQTITP
ncbi:MAG: translocation/assembly module TamB, partial [Chitinophagaceae bacterium]|nr:translocation/assembly module TamB [Chitinophagaceae bacterium]